MSKCYGCLMEYTPDKNRIQIAVYSERDEPEQIVTVIDGQQNENQRYKAVIMAAFFSVQEFVQSIYKCHTNGVGHQKGNPLSLM